MLKGDRLEKRWFVQHQDRTQLFQSNERAGAYFLMGRTDYDTQDYNPSRSFPIADFGHNKDLAVRCAELFNELGSELKPEHNYLSQRRKVEARDRSTMKKGLLNVQG